MLMLSRVCAEFRDGAGAVIFRVTPAMRLTFVEAPEAIREDPLFHLLLQEGSVETPDSVETRKKLEADPLKGTEPSGRRSRSARIPASDNPEGAEKKDGA